MEIVILWLYYTIPLASAWCDELQVRLINDRELIQNIRYKYLLPNWPIWTIWRNYATVRTKETNTGCRDPPHLARPSPHWYTVVSNTFPAPEMARNQSPTLHIMPTTLTLAEPALWWQPLAKVQNTPSWYTTVKRTPMAYMGESTIYQNNSPRDASHVGRKTRAEWALARSWNPRIRFPTTVTSQTEIK